METSTDRRRTVVRALSLLLVLACACAVVGCASRAAGPVDWAADDVISYRLVSQNDFLARTSNSAWGNFAHGAEICVHILPAGQDEGSSTFRAVMKRECSFWNRATGPLGFFGRLAALFSPVPVPVPVKQPDEYILQHEQLHFAIMQVAALKLTRRMQELPTSRRTRSLVRRAYSLTLLHVIDRHRELDEETSGTYRPHELEKWVRVLEAQMQEICGEGEACPVRTAATTDPPTE